ncbi:MAG: DNA-invertase hin [Candidatus Heimdallarchaeota archaeon LC_3]|nr:MAG: DNA-invertase hin [Candidatus Heimdallarchaeota archaeon LC_3]
MDSSVTNPLNDISNDLEFIIRQKKSSKSEIKNLSDILRVGIYRRVSTREQAEDGQSLQAQKNKIKNYLSFDTNFSDKQLDIFEFVDEGKSAKDMNREGMKKLVESVVQEKLDFVVVVKLDRLTRRLADLQYLTDLFQKHNVHLVSINEKLDTESATGRFFITILGSLAQLEREQVSERVQDVFENIVEKQPLGGYSPYGYFYIQGIKKYFPYIPDYCKNYNIPYIETTNDSEKFYPGLIVPEIFYWYLSFKSYNKVAKKLTDLLIPTPIQIQNALNNYFKEYSNSGNQDPFLVINESKKWSRQTVKNILSNPFYAGVRVWNRYQNRLKMVRSPEKWILIHDDHPNLIESNLFRKTYDKMNSH